MRSGKSEKSNANQICGTDKSVPYTKNDVKKILGRPCVVAPTKNHVKSSTDILSNSAFLYALMMIKYINGITITHIPPISVNGNHV